jgi:hypothetical protein|tara:strand:- start:887 stop:1081 length:195 start_codon:yes stop_codon:yes gene_type:complete
MFAESLQGNPSPEAIATAKAAIDVTEGKVPLSTACSMYNVREQAVIQYIIDKTEHDTVLDMKEV